MKNKTPLVLLLIIVGAVVITGLIVTDKGKVTQKIDVEESRVLCDLSKYKESEIWNFTPECCSSMYPVINNSDNVSAVRVTVPNNITIGDVVVAQKDRFTYIMHRLIDINTSTSPITYVTRADNEGGEVVHNPDGSITQTNIIVSNEYWTFKQIKYKGICVNGYEIE